MRRRLKSSLRSSLTAIEACSAWAVGFRQLYRQKLTFGDIADIMYSCLMITVNVFGALFVYDLINDRVVHNVAYSWNWANWVFFLLLLGSLFVWLCDYITYHSNKKSPPRDYLLSRRTVRVIFATALLLYFATTAYNRKFGYDKMDPFLPPAGYPPS